MDGETATINNGTILESNGINPLIVRLSGEKDPDEYIIKNGVDALLMNINNPLNFLEFKLSFYKKNKDLNKTTDLVKYIKEMINSIKDIDDELTKELTIKKMSEEYDISISLLESELAKVSTVKEKKVEPEKKLAKIPISKYDIACQNIIYFMMNGSIYVDKFKKDLGYLNIKKYRDIANEIIYYLEKSQDIDMASFITFINDKEELNENVLEIIKNINLEELTINDFNEFIKVALNEEKKEEIKRLKKELDLELDENKKVVLANKIIELKKGCVG